MNRETILKAVKLGLRRSQGKSLDDVAESVVTSMEIAMEMAAEETAERPLDFPMVSVNPPVPPQAVHPVGPDGGGLIDTVSESYNANPAPEMRSLRRSAQPISLEKLLEVLHSHAPESIEITVTHPERGPRIVRLTRNVIADPIAKGARLVYKHPDLSDEMAVTTVFNAEGDPPDLAAAMADIRRRAEKLYAPRPRYIEPAPPPSSGIDFPVMDPSRIKEAQAEAATAPDARSLSGMAFPGGFNFNR